MAWSDKQWAAFCSLVREGWPGEFDQNAARAWRALLDDVEPADAVRGLKALIAKGNRFRPSPAEIVGELRTDPTRPTFDETLAQMRRAIQVRPDDAAIDRAREWMHPWALAFLQAFGVARFRRLPVDDDEWGPKHTQDLRQAFERFEQRAESRERHGLELTPGRGGEPKRLEPGETLRQLGAPDHVHHLRPA